VEPAFQQRRRHLGPAACQLQLRERLLGVGMGFAAFQQARGFIQAALPKAQVGEAYGGVRPHAAGSGVEALERADQLELRLGPISDRRQHAGVGGATGAGHTSVVVGVQKWARHLAPLLGALEVDRSLAPREQRAVDLPHGLRCLHLAGRGGGHRLVEPDAALVQAPERQHGQAAVRESERLVVGVAESVGDLHRALGANLDPGRVIGGQGADEDHPAGLGRGFRSAEVPLALGDPAPGHRRIALQPRVLTRQPERRPGGPAVLGLTPEERVGVFHRSEGALQVVLPEESEGQTLVRLAATAPGDRGLVLSLDRGPVRPARRGTSVRGLHTRLDPAMTPGVHPGTNPGVELRARVHPRMHSSL